MTKEKIIEIVNACVQYNANQGTWSIDNKFADELLTLFKQELLERLEQLHAEMDERMREEVAIEKRMGEKKAENLLNQIEELTIGKCALRCPLVEQGKTNLLKEFVEWLKYEYAREEHFEMKEAKDCQQKEYTYLYEYHRGREAMAEKIRDMLDQDLKKFMEERK